MQGLHRAVDRVTLRIRHPQVQISGWQRKAGPRANEALFAAARRGFLLRAKPRLDLFRRAVVHFRCRTQLSFLEVELSAHRYLERDGWLTGRNPADR